MGKGCQTSTTFESSIPRARRRMTVACPTSTRIALCLRRSRASIHGKSPSPQPRPHYTMSLHQSHGVPWSCITRHFTFLPNSRPCAASRPHHVVLRFEPSTDPRSPDRVANAARVMRAEQHFVRVLSSQIVDFSCTEKLKMNRLPSIRDGDHLFSPRLFDNLELIPASSLQQNASRELSGHTWIAAWSQRLGQEDRGRESSATTIRQSSAGLRPQCSRV
jgi:hypothetical protein